jgi:Pyridoxamine 5'-phosphate oxidase
VWSNRTVHETPEELRRLQGLLDESMAAAGPHLRGIVTEERRLSAAELCRRLHGMRLLVLATVTADGRPLTGAVDGYLIHGTFHFSSGRDSVRMRHLAARPTVSATHLPSDALAVTVHGDVELFDLLDPQHPDLRQAMIDHYLPSQGPGFVEWLESEGPIGGRIDARRVFTFHLDG